MLTNFLFCLPSGHASTNFIFLFTNPQGYPKQL
jgi:hypothetical protein